MLINADKCVGCSLCVETCPVEAIHMVEKQAVIDLDACLECGNCKIAGVCKPDAIVQQTMVWPRLIRRILSNVRVAAPNTGIQGRGTEEMKTNDVTGRYQPGMAGVACELGRPGVGTDFRDVQTVAKVMLANGAKLERDNPIALVFEDLEAGVIKQEYLAERVLSVVLEALIPRDNLPVLLKELDAVQHKVDTVFSLGVASIMEDGAITTNDVVTGAGYSVRPNGKTCVGLGRPLKEI